MNTPADAPAWYPEAIARAGRDPAQRLPRRVVPAAQARHRRLRGRRRRTRSWSGAGCDEILALCAQLALGRGDTALVAKPTYQLYAVASRNAGAEVLALDARRRASRSRSTSSCARPATCAWSGSAARTTRRASSSTPRSSSASARPARASSCSTRPTSSSAARTSPPLVARHENLVVTRTFSKGFALGAARVGYGLAQPALAEALDALRPPGSISSWSAAVAELACHETEELQRALRRDRRGARLAGRGHAPRRRRGAGAGRQLRARALARARRLHAPRRARLRRAHVRARAAAGRLLPRHRLAPRRQRPAAARARRARGRRGAGAGAGRARRAHRRGAARDARDARSRCASACSAAGARASRPASASSTTCSRASRSGRSPTSTCAARGDLWVDEHHTVEDCAIALGEALDLALGDRAGRAPLRLGARAARRGAGGGHRRPLRPRHRRSSTSRSRAPAIGRMPSTLVPHFFDSFARRGRLGLHVSATGDDAHHVTEAAFKARRARAARGRRARPGAQRHRQHEGRAVIATIVDYGAGNLRSLRAAFERAGAEVARQRRARARSRRAGLVVIPGVGQAAAAMEALRERGLVDAILARAARRRAPVRRVRRACSSCSRAARRARRPGSACCPAPRRSSTARAGCRTWAGTTSSPPRPHPLTAAFPATCYFAHSYAVQDAAPRCLLASTEVEHGAFASLVGEGRVAGAQFHPERSGAAGAAFLRARHALGRRCCVGASSRASTSRTGASSRASTSSTCATAASPSRPRCATPSRAPTRSCWLNITATGEDPARSAAPSSARPSRSTSRSRSAAASTASAACASCCWRAPTRSRSTPARWRGPA